MITTTDTILRCDSVSSRYGEVRVLHEIDLTIGRGEFVALVGPSGSGKTTLLRALIGTHLPATGKVEITHLGPSGKRVTTRVTGPGKDRGIVYQQYSLYPDLSALDNVVEGLVLSETGFLSRLMLPLQRKRMRDYRERAAALLDRFGLGHVKDQYPSSLSGGQQQRVAIAQTIIMKPDVLFLDEPFGALDEETRESMQNMLLGLMEENEELEEERKAPCHTVIIVTHQLNEALYVADRVLGLSQHWDWKSVGQGACPGAKIVYDEPAPTYRLGMPRPEEAVFRAQREDIRRIVMGDT